MVPTVHTSGVDLQWTLRIGPNSELLEELQWTLRIGPNSELLEELQWTVTGSPNGVHL